MMEGGRVGSREDRKKLRGSEDEKIRKKLIDKYGIRAERFMWYE